MSAPGYFGKLPGAGDFVQRRLPPEFVDPWDRAISHAMAGARDRLGADWSDAYRSAPAWRFLLSPGIAGRDGWCGVMLPASDRVGRCFPMVVAARLAPGGAYPGVLADGGQWYEAAAAIAWAAQADPGIDAARFDAAIGALAMPASLDEPTVPALPPAIDRARRDYWLPWPADGRRLLAALWGHLAEDGCSLWWHPADFGGNGALYLGRGLPDAAAFLGFLRGGARAEVA